MNDSQTITIQNRFDIIEARMQVRTLARKIGLDLFDQARISLATSTVAIILQLERTGQGTITMEQLLTADRMGIQVVCINQSGTLHELASTVLDDARRMVDDLAIEALPSSGVKVTLIKWVKASKRRAMPNSRSPDRSQYTHARQPTRP